MKALLAFFRAGPSAIWAEHMLPRYQRLARREQRLLLASAIVLPLLILVFGLWLPMRDDASAIRASLPALQGQLAEAQALANRVATAGPVSGVQADLLSTVDGAARSSRVRQYITRIKPQVETSGQRVLVQLRKAPYADLVRFFALMAEKGIASERMRMTDVSGNGLVDVDITFSSG